MKPQLLFIRLGFLVLTTGLHGFAQPSEFKATSPPFRFDIRRLGPRLPASPDLTATSPPVRFDIRRFKSLRRVPESYALLIANEKYNDSRFRNLPDATLDAEQIGSTLKTGFGFRTQLVPNATYSTLKSKLQELGNRPWQKDEQLLIYISGHGDYENREGFLVMKDTDKDQPNTYFPLVLLKSLVAHHACRHILLVLDICYGGAISQSLRTEAGVFPGPAGDCQEQRNDLNTYFACVIKDQTRLYLSSGSLDVVRGGKDGENSPFAKSLLQKLSETARAASKTLSVAELKQHLEKDNPQLTFASEAAGDFLFVAH